MSTAASTASRARARSASYELTSTTPFRGRKSSTSTPASPRTACSGRRGCLPPASAVSIPAPATPSTARATCTSSTFTTSATRFSAVVRRRFLPSSHSRSVGPVWTIGSTSTTRQTDLRESTFGIRHRWNGPPQWGISITSPLRCLHRRVNSPSSGPSGTDRSIRTFSAAPHSRCGATVPGGAS